MTILLKNKITIEKIYFFSIVIFALFLPLSRALISLFVILLPLIWLFEGNFRKKFEIIKKNRVLLSILLFLGYSNLSLLWTQNFEDGLNILRLNSYLFTLFVIATSIRQKHINIIITAFLVGMFISEVIAYGVFFELWQFKYATIQNPSPFMMHIDYSVYLAFTSILLLNRLISSYYTFKEKFLIIIFFVTVTGNLFLSIGRTGQIALIVGIIVMSIIHFRFSIKSFVYAVVLVSMIFISAYSISESFKLRSNQAINDVNGILNMDFNSSWGIRVAYWVITYNVVKENLFGVGLGDYKDAIKDKVIDDNGLFLSEETKKFMQTNHPHNQFLLVILQSGIIGIFLFFNIFYNFFSIKRKSSEIKENSILFMTIFLVSCMAEPLFIKQYPLALFILFVGLFVSDDK